MASPIVVKKALRAFANNYGKTEQWVEATLKLWSRGLASIHDQDLIRGTEEWCRNKARPPNLARLCELIEANPKTLASEALTGCPACNSTGWREMARWYESNRKLLVFTCVAACDCLKGLAFQTGPAIQWDRVVAGWKADPYTNAVYHSTGQKYHLDLEQRMSPEQFEAYKVALTKPVQKSVGSWSKVKA